MQFTVTEEQRLIITAAAVKRLRAYAQHNPRQAEAGGALLGRLLLGSDDIVIDDITVPQRSDRRTRTSFFRSRRHEEIALDKWRASQGTLAYLGLWHTHPERDPVPSFIDRRDWDKAVARDAFAGERLFFIIVGTERIRVWTKTRNQPIQALAIRSKT